MPYKDKFQTTDDLISSLEPIIRTLDGSIQSKFIGFFSVSAVTVFELAIKSILIDYANKKHIDYGSFMGSYLARLNGKIKIEDLKKTIRNCGEAYTQAFEQELKKAEAIIFNTEHQDLRSCYNNLILCRHKFVHANNITLTLQECINDYNIGKAVISALHNSMK